MFTGTGVALNELSSFRSGVALLPALLMAGWVQELSPGAGVAIQKICAVSNVVWLAKSLVPTIM